MRSPQSNLHQMVTQHLPGMALFAYDRDLHLLLVDGTALEQLGISKTGAEGKPIIAVFPPEAAQAFEPLCRAALAGETRTVQQTLKNDVYNAQFSPLRNEQQTIYAGLLVLQNVTEAQRAADALHASETRYRLMAENSTDLISIHTPDGTIVDASPAASLLLGYEPAAMVGRNIFDTIHPEDVERVRKVSNSIAASTDTANVTTIAYRIRCRDGAYIWLESASRLISSPDNGNQIISASRDVSERMSANEALRRSEEQFRSLIASMDNMVFCIDLNGYFLIYHPMPLSIYDTPFDSKIFVGRHYRDVLPPVFSEQLDQAVQIVTSTLNTQQIDYGLTLNGEERAYSARISPMIGPNLQLLGSTVVVSDMSEVLHAQRRESRLLALEKIQHETSLLLLENEDPNQIISEVLAILGSFFDISRAYMFRIRENERLFDSVHEWYAPGSQPERQNLQGIAYDEIFPSLMPLLVKEGVIAVENISQLPPDIYRALAAFGVQSALYLPFFVDQRLEGFVAMYETRHPRTWLPEEIATIRTFMQSCSRMFERQRAQLALIEARDAALRSARLKTDFVSNMSHEIRTPMTGVIGMIDLLRETELTSDQRELAEIAHTSANRLLLLIGDILDFSKIEAGKVALEQIPLDIRGVVTEVQSLLDVQASKKGLHLSSNVADDVPARVLGDPTRLRQILTNLVGNAIKFTEKGSVQIELKQVSTVYGRTRLRFEVNDTGIGIPMEQQAIIFDSFVQADGSTTRRFGGAGLGLAICKQLVTLMGGEIDVTSATGLGSTFSFTLTLPIVALNNRATVNTDFNNLQVMVADEENSARYLLAEQLRLWGTHVIEASSLEEALALLTATARREEEVEMLLLRTHQSLDKQEAFAAILRETLASQTPLVVQFYDDEALTYPEFDIRLRRPVHPSDLYQLLAKHHQNGYGGADEIADHHIIAPSIGGRVLVADDEPMNRQIVVHALEEFGYTVDIARNGEEVLEMIDQHPYQIILMDMHMPIMDGLEATRRIRARGDGKRELPIVAFTASIEKSEQQRYLDNGVNAIIGKPFSVRDLRQVVERWRAPSPT